MLVSQITVSSHSINHLFNVGLFLFNFLTGFIVVSTSLPDIISSLKNKKPHLLQGTVLFNV